jgi:PadR family transcriptional regulator PadR
MGETNPAFMNGVPELLVLRCLVEREMYGYELVQEIRSRTDEALAAGEGVIYPLLHALERDGAVSSSRRTVQGRSRVYYALTPKGGERFAGLKDTWLTLTLAIRGALEGTGHAAAV